MVIKLNSVLRFLVLITITNIPSANIGLFIKANPRTRPVIIGQEFFSTFNFKKSKIRIEEIINEKINSVSYPHGSYNSNIFAILDNLEYQYAFSSIKGLNNVSTNKYLLRRSEIISTDKVKDLNKKIKGFYDFY